MHNNSLSVVELIDLSDEVTVKLSSKKRRTDVQNDWDGGRPPSNYEINEFIKSLVERHARLKFEDLIIDGKDPKVFEPLRVKHSGPKMKKDSERWGTVVKLLYGNKEACLRAVNSLQKVSKTALRGVVMKVKCKLGSEESEESGKGIFATMTDTKFRLMLEGRRPDTLCLRGVPRNWFGIIDRPPSEIASEKKNEKEDEDKGKDNIPETNEETLSMKAEATHDEELCGGERVLEKTGEENRAKNINDTKQTVSNSNETKGDNERKKKKKRLLIIKRPQRAGQGGGESIDHSKNKNRSDGSEGIEDMNKYDSKTFFIPGDQNWNPSRLTLDLARFPNPTLLAQFPGIRPASILRYAYCPSKIDTEQEERGMPSEDVDLYVQFGNLKATKDALKLYKKKVIRHRTTGYITDPKAKIDATGYMTSKAIKARHKATHELWFRELRRRRAIREAERMRKEKEKRELARKQREERLRRLREEEERKQKEMKRLEAIRIEKEKREQERLEAERKRAEEERKRIEDEMKRKEEEEKRAKELEEDKIRCLSLINEKKVTCPKGHALRSFITDVDGYGCDICEKRDILKDSCILGCRACNWDACRNCWDQLKHFEPKPILKNSTGTDSQLIGTASGTTHAVADREEKEKRLKEMKLKILRKKILMKRKVAAQDKSRGSSNSIVPKHGKKRARKDVADGDTIRRWKMEALKRKEEREKTETPRDNFVKSVQKSLITKKIKAKIEDSKTNAPRRRAERAEKPPKKALISSSSVLDAVLGSDEDENEKDEESMDDSHSLEDRTRESNEMDVQEQRALKRLKELQVLREKLKAKMRKRS